MIQNKRILFISPFVSWPRHNGAIVRSHHLANQLAEHNTVWYVHRTNQTPLPVEPKYTPVQTTKHKIDQVFNIVVLMKLLKLVKRHDIDFILASHLWSGLYGILLKVISGKKLIFDNHNVEMLRFRRSGNPIWPLIYVIEFSITFSADMIYCVSRQDFTYLRSYYNIQDTKMQVVANGVDVSMLSKYHADIINIRTNLGIYPDDALILYFGSLTYKPNQQAINIIQEQVIPRLLREDFHFKVIVAGAGGKKYQTQHKVHESNLIFTDFVDDIHALIFAADVVIVPITSGSGTRLKIIESIACGKPVISTRIGAEGLDSEAAGDLLTICDSWESFSEQIIKQSKMPKRDRPSRVFMELYDWKKIVEGIEFDW